MKNVLLKNAYLLAKVGADTAENEGIFPKFARFGNDPTPLPPSKYTNVPCPSPEARERKTGVLVRCLQNTFEMGNR